MTITAIAGAIGSGKSFYQLKIALEMAQLKKKQLVFNFPIDRAALRIYANTIKLDWIIYLLDFGGITEIHAPKNLQVLMLPQAVVCLDEAGILLNARAWRSTPQAFLSDLCQSRKSGTDLIWAAQFVEQVDSQMRMLTQFWIEASGLTYYDKVSRLPRLYYKRYYYMEAGKHQKWLSNQPSHLKTRLAYTYRYHGGFLSPIDRMLFDCFDTTTRLDKSAGGYAKYESLEYCRLDDRPVYSNFTQSTFEARRRLLESNYFPLSRHYCACDGWQISGVEFDLSPYLLTGLETDSFPE